MLPGLVLAALVVAAASSRRHGRAGAVVLAGLSLLWLLVNGSMEGTVLWTLSPDRGLTAADLAGLTGLALAARQGLESRRERARRDT